MAKKSPKKTKSISSSSEPVISKKGLKIVGGGIATVIIGFIVLSFTDPHGANMASHVSPFLIIGGYAIVGIGIIAKDPS